MWQIGEGEELLVVPLSGGDISALAVGEHGLVLGAEEIGNRVAVLGRVEGDHPVDARLHLVPARKPKRVPNVDDGAPFLGLDKSKFPGSWWPDLEPPLFTEQEGERTDVGVLLVSDLLVNGRIGWNVMHHGKSCSGWPVVAVGILKTCSTGEAKSGGQSRENSFGDNVTPSNSILEN